MTGLESIPQYIFTIYFFLTGLAIGSFVNVCIYRLPKKESILTPRSHCTACNTQILTRDNIPVLSYLLLGGKCRSCGEKISPIYPAIEIITAFLFTSVYLRFGLSMECLIYAMVVPTLVIITAIDIQHQIIPDKVTLPGIAFGLICGAYLNGIWDSLGGALLGGGSFLLISELYFRLRGAVGMGGGDIKYIAAAGALLGWEKILVVIFLSALIGALTGVMGLALKKLTFLSRIPFGPFLAMGTIAVIFFGDEIISLYLSTMIVKK